MKGLYLYWVSFWSGDEDVLTPEALAVDWGAVCLTRLPEQLLIQNPHLTLEVHSIQRFIEGQTLMCFHFVHKLALALLLFENNNTV